MSYKFKPSHCAESTRSQETPWLNSAEHNVAVNRDLFEVAGSRLHEALSTTMPAMLHQQRASTQDVTADPPARSGAHPTANDPKAKLQDRRGGQEQTKYRGMVASFPCIGIVVSAARADRF